MAALARQLHIKPYKTWKCQCKCNRSIECIKKNQILILSFILFNSISFIMRVPVTFDNDDDNDDDADDKNEVSALSSHFFL